MSPNRNARRIVGAGRARAGMILLGIVFRCGCARAAWVLELGLAVKGGGERLLGAEGGARGGKVRLVFGGRNLIRDRVLARMRCLR